MNELTFKDSMSTCHKIVTDAKGKKYLMDTSTISPNTYTFGFLPKEVVVEMVEIDAHNRSLEQKVKTSPKYVAVAALGQVISTVLFRYFHQLFLKYHIHQQVLLKCLLFLFSFFVAYLLAKLYIQVMKNKVKDRLPSNSKRYIARFTTGNKRHFSGWSILVVNLIIFIFFMNLNNGTEGVILVLNSMVAHLFFVCWLGMEPIDFDYEKQLLKLVSIEEIQ